MEENDVKRLKADAIFEPCEQAGRIADRVIRSSGSGGSSVEIMIPLSLVPSVYHLPVYISARDIIRRIKASNAGVWSRTSVRFLLLSEAGLRIPKFESIFLRSFSPLFPEAPQVAFEETLERINSLQGTEWASPLSKRETPWEGEPEEGDPTDPGLGACSGHLAWIREAIRVKELEVGSIANLILADLAVGSREYMEEGRLPKGMKLLRTEELLKVTSDGVSKLARSASEHEGESRQLARAVLEASLGKIRQEHPNDSLSECIRKMNCAEALFLEPFLDGGEGSSAVDVVVGGEVRHECTSFLQMVLQVLSAARSKGHETLLVIDQWLKAMILEAIEQGGGSGLLRDQLKDMIVSSEADPPEAGDDLPVFMTPLQRMDQEEVVLPTAYCLGLLHEAGGDLFPIHPRPAREDLLRFSGLKKLAEGSSTEDLPEDEKSAILKKPGGRNEALEDWRRYGEALPRVFNDGFTALQTKTIEELKYVL